jgi:hypothetical protein
VNARLARWAPGALVVVVAAAFFAPELFGGRVAMTMNMDRWLPWAAEATPDEISAPSHNPDCATSYYPRRALLKAAAEDGVVPLWNPYSFCGMPFLADPQSGVLYPPNWLLLPFHPRTQMGLFLFLHGAWGGLGVLALLRRRDVPGLPAALVGAAFVANGYFAKHFGQPPFLATAAWAPWAIALALDVVERPDRVRLAKLSFVGAMLFLAGQPQIAFHSTYAVLIVLAGAVLATRSTAPRPGRALLALAGAGALAILLVAAQLLPTLELASRSARAVLPYSTVVSGAFHPLDLVRFLVPDFFGTPLSGDEWSPLFPRGDSFYLRNQLNSIFAGGPIFLLALGGMVSPATRRRALPFTVLFLLAILVAFGTPLARLAYEILPGFRFSRIDRAGFLVVLAQTVPAGLAAAALARGGGWGRRAYGVAILVVSGLGYGLVLAAGEALPVRLGADPAAAAAIGFDADAASVVARRTGIAALFAAGTGVAFLLPASRAAGAIPLVLAAVQIFLFSSPYRGDRRPGDVFADSPGIDRLAAVLAEDEARGGGRFVRFGRDLPVVPYRVSSVLPPSTNAPWRLRDVQGYNALADRSLGETLETALGEDVFSHGIWSGRRIVAPERPASLDHPLLEALAVRAIVGAAPLEADGWTLVSTAGFALRRRDAGSARVRLVASGRGVPRERMDRLLATGRFDPEREAVWVDERADAPTVGPGSGDVGHVEVRRDSWNELEIRTNADGERMLVVADAWSPGWRARIDGRPAEILPVWGVVRGVVLPAGAHRVEMEYRPASFRRGALLSLLGVLLAGAALAWPGRDLENRGAVG